MTTIETGTQHTQTQRPTLPLIGAAVLLVAAAMLAYRMNAFSMWLDELNMVKGTLSLTFRAGHPPLYFLLARGWIALAGQSDFALRTLSLLAVLPGLAAAYRLGVDFTHKHFAGIAAATLLGSMGFVRYYAHQTHNYALLLTLATLLLFFYVRWWQHPGKAVYGAGVVLSTAALLYTHYYGLYVVVALNLYSLVIGTRQLRRLLHWVLLQALVAVLYAPWLPVVLRLGESRFISEAGSEAFSLTTGQQTSLATVVETADVMLSHLGWLYAALILAGGIGVWLKIRQPGGRMRTALHPAALLVVFIVGSMALALTANLFYQTFLHRRVIYILPALAILIGYLLAALPRTVHWPMLGAAVIISFAAGWSTTLPGNWFYRQIVEAIQPEVHPYDVVLIQFNDDPFIGQSLRYYAEQLLPEGSLIFMLGDYSLEGAHNRDYFANQVFADMIWARDRFWVIHSGDPDDYFASLEWVSQIEGRSFTPEEVRFAGWLEAVRFTVPVQTRGAMPGAADLPEKAALPQRVGDDFELVNYQIDHLIISPGESVALWLDWDVLAVPDEDLQVYVHLIGGENEPVTTADSPPSHLGRILATHFWMPGVRIFDTHTLSVPGDIPTGEYQVRIGMYRLSSLERLVFTAPDGQQSDGVTLATLRVR